MLEQKQGIIHFLEKHVSDMDNEFDTLDKKAQQNIAVSSVIAAIVAALKFGDTLPKTLQSPLLLAIFAIYAVIFIVSFMALAPRTWLRTPLNPTHENVKKVESKKPDEYYQWLVDTYIYIEARNARVLRWKNWLVVAGMTLIGLDIIVIAFAALNIR